MLRAFCGRDGGEVDLDTARWVDLLDPSEDEIARVEQKFGVTVPSR
ncbi:MAG: hypothetical protein JWO65_520 [Sphingomonas bacterium]|nr:hypothetical protein [Sphingomonas bacterium]